MNIQQKIVALNLENENEFHVELQPLLCAKEGLDNIKIISCGLSIPAQKPMDVDTSRRFSNKINELTAIARSFNEKHFR